MTQLIWGSLSLLITVAAIVVWAIGGAARHFDVVVLLILAVIFALWTIAPRPPRPQLPPRP